MLTPVNLLIGEAFWQPVYFEGTWNSDDNEAAKSLISNAFLFVRGPENKAANPENMTPKMLDTLFQLCYY